MRNLCHSTVSFATTSFALGLFTLFIFFPSCVMDEAGVRRVVAENNRDLLIQIKDLMNSSISDLKQPNKSIASHQMSKIKRLMRDSIPYFNKRSDKEQCKSKKAIKDAVEDGQIALESSDIEKTKQA